MSKKKKFKAPDEEKKNPNKGKKNYQHAAGEIEALRAMLKKRRKGNEASSEQDENNRD